MEARIKQYLVCLKHCAPASFSREERQVLRAELLVQIQFFQHERLIHLIVTITFAILLMLSVIGSCLFTNPFFLLLALFMLLLLMPYIRHYYILENGVQKLYQFYDEVTDGNAELMTDIKKSDKANGT